MNDERALLLAIMEKPDDDARRLVYADWLEEHNDDLRAEFLRLVVKWRQERVVTPEQRQQHSKLSEELLALQTQLKQAWGAGQVTASAANELQRQVEERQGELARLSRQLLHPVPPRLQELAAPLDTRWLAVVSDPEIEGCARSTGSIWRPLFAFVCDKSWSEMTTTDDDHVRSCESCGRNVHFCDTLADAREHSQEGRCIAVDLGVIRRDGDLVPPLLLAGQPSQESLRRSYEENVDEVSRARLKAKKKRPRRRSKRHDPS